MRRVLLKLSGEALMGKEKPGDNINSVMLAHFANEIAEARSMGIQLAVVLGAGNIVRGSAFAEENNFGRIQGDYMGMLATVINSMALQSKLQDIGITTRLQTAVSMDQLAQIYIREKAVSGLEDGRVVIFAGGTGNPFFTTDTAAALRAAEIKADALLKGTNIDGIYTGDPEKDKNCELIERTTFNRVINDRLAVMDATAFTMCRDQGIPINIFNIHKAGNLAKVLRNERIGTRIDPE